MLDQHSADYLLNKIRGYTWTEGYDFSISDIDGRILVSTGIYEKGFFSDTAAAMIQEYNGNQFHSPDVIMTDLEDNRAWSLITLRGFAIGAYEVRGSDLSERGIRQMTELLDILTAGYCRENVEERNLKAVTDFYEEWLIAQKASMSGPLENAEYEYYRSLDNQNDDNFVLKGKVLGIDITIPRTVYVLKMIKEPGEEGEHLTVEAKRRLRYRLEGYLSQNANNLSVLFGDYIVLLLPGSEEDVLYLVNKVRSNLELMYECKVSGGSSEQYSRWKEAGECFRKAKIACDTAQLVDDSTMIKYDARSVALLLNMIPSEMRREFYKKVFHDCDEDEINEYMETMKVFFECDRSLTRTADKMFVHKNTLKYRLNRMKEKLGLDPRDNRDFMILYILMMLRRLEEAS